MGGTNPTDHDRKIKIFIQVPNEEVIPYFVVSPSKTLM